MLFGCLGEAEVSIILSIFVIPLLFLIILLIDIMRNEFKGNIKIAWILVVLFGIIDWFEKLNENLYEVKKNIIKDIYASTTP